MESQPPSKKKKLQKPLSHFFASKSSCDSSDKNSPKEPSKVEENVSKSSRKFVPKWSEKHKWLTHDAKEDLMYCTLCKDRGFQNTFALGTSNFKLFAVQRHEEHRDHLMAADVPKQQRNMKHAVDKAMTKEENAIIKCMKVIHWMCCEAIPLSKYKSFISLLKELGTPDLEALNIGDTVNYSSYETAIDLLKSMSATVDASVTEQIKRSPVLTLLTDESTDIMVHHKLVINCRIVNPDTLLPSTLYLSDIRITDSTGKGIFNAIKDHLAGRQISVSTVTGLGTDGAAVMTGKGEGLTGHFLRENPHLINTHCAAHRVALISQQAAQVIAALVYFMKILESVFYHFKKSPVKCDKLLAIQKVLDDPQIKYREVHSVRWLSFYIVVESIYRTLDSLLTYLTEAGIKDPAANGLKKKIGTDFFISTIYHMMDILQPIMRLNLFFQKKDVDIGNVQAAVDACTNDLKGMLSDQSTDLPTFTKQLAVDVVDKKYKGQHEITTSKYKAEPARKQFIQELLNNLEKRFPDKELMTSFCILGLKPIRFVEDRKTWGDSSLEVLLSHYGEEKVHVHKGSRYTSPPLLDKEETKHEWIKLKDIVVAQSYPVESTAKLWELINTHHAQEFPNLIKLAALALAHPVHTSDCERSFSAQNQVTTALRNRLGADNCDMIMRVKIQWGNTEYMDCLKHWRKEKHRVLFREAKN